MFSEMQKSMYEIGTMGTLRFRAFRTRCVLQSSALEEHTSACTFLCICPVILPPECVILATRPSREISPLRDRLNILLLNMFVLVGTETTFRFFAHCSIYAR